MGWPVEWLKRMISADEFDLWCAYHRRSPIDDQSNHHHPIANLHAHVANMMGGKKTMRDCLLVRPPDAASSGTLIRDEDW